MTIQVAPNAQPLTATALRSRAEGLTTSPQAEPGDSFVKSRGVGEKIRGYAVMGGLALAGAALGAYAGLATGILPGLAGCVAGTAGGAIVATKLPGQPLGGGAIVGAIAGTLIGATVANPVAAVALGLAGATAPVGLLLAVFAGAE